jgi:hypothetical protein
MPDRPTTGSVPPLGELFPFPLDPFQLEAIDALNIGHSVVVQRIESGKPSKEEAARYPGAVMITRKSKLIEISYTPIPMNGECQAYAVADEAAIVTQQPATKARRKIVILG